MTQKELKELLEAVEAAIQAGDWKVDGACDPDLVIRRAKKALAQPEQEPVAWPPVQFEKVAEGVEIGYDLLGGVDIRLGGEFVYVHINYDYRYTHNSARKALADQIVGLLTTPPQRKPLTEDQRKWIVATCPTPRHIIDAVEAAHGIKEKA